MRWTYEHVHEYLSWSREAFLRTASGATVRTNWAGPNLDASGFRREFIAALHNRINLKGGLPVEMNACVYVPGVGRTGWRKLDSDWQSSASRDARRINEIRSRRVRVYATEITTDDWRKRFAGLFAERD